VIIEVGANDTLDISSSDMLGELISAIHAAGIDVAIADVRQGVVDMARRTGLLDVLGEDRIFPTIDLAVRALVPGGTASNALAPQ
jgi:hypothetical protein